MSYIGNTIQISKENPYNIPCGGITQRLCEVTDGITDWAIDKQSCGVFIADQPICVKPNGKDCFLGLNDNGKDPFVSVKWNQRAPNIQCSYNINEMNSLNVIRNYEQKFGQTQDYNRMMAQLCIQPGKQCSTQTICSNLRSLTEEGDECRRWYNNQSNETKDAIIANICFRFRDADECKCFLRSLDESYIAAKRAIPFNDGCWYPPCQQSGVNLVTSDIIKPSCPSNLCQIVFNELRNRDVKINDVQNAISCSFQVDSPQPTPTPIPTPSPPTQPTPPQRVDSSTPILISIFVLMIVTFLTALYAIYLNRKRK